MMVVVEVAVDRNMSIVDVVLVDDRVVRMDHYSLFDLVALT